MPLCFHLSRNNISRNTLEDMSNFHCMHMLLDVTTNWNYLCWYSTSKLGNVVKSNLKGETKDKISLHSKGLFIGDAAVPRFALKHPTKDLLLL